MEPGLTWILGGLLLLGTELLLPGVFLVWVGLAAIGSGLFILALGAPPLWQTALVFLVLLGGGIALALRLRRPGPRPLLNTPTAGLVGRTGILLATQGPGLRIRLGDSDWPARLPRDVPEATAGDRVRVEAVDGVTLVVRPE